MCQSHSEWPVLVLNRGRLVWPSNWKPIEFAFKTESNAGLHFKGTPRSVQSVPYFILPIIEHPPQLRLLSSKINTKVKSYFNTSYLTDSYISFTLKLESRQKICSNSLIRSRTYGKKIFLIFLHAGRWLFFTICTWPN